MDVKELMAFKPAHTPKRPAPGEASRGPEELTDDDPTDSYEARAKKRKLAMKKAQEVRESCVFVCFLCLVLLKEEKFRNI